MSFELRNVTEKEDGIRLTPIRFVLVGCMVISCVVLLATDTVYNAEMGAGVGVKTWNVLDWLSQQAVLSTDFSCHNNCNNFTFSYIIRNSCRDRPFLLFFVVVAHNNSDARDAIRQTWGSIRSYRGKSIKTVFVLGEHENETLNAEILSENAKYKDIVMGRFPDKYRTLTEKVMFALRWSMDHCEAEYMVKTDDDIFHVPYRYIDYLLDNELPERFVGGRCVTTRPTRTETVKTYVSRDIYPYNYSPYYCQGGGYIISQTAARDIVKIAPHVRYTPMEDQFVSGICRYTMLIPYFQIDGVLAKKGAQTQPCTLKKLVKSTHKIYPDEMYQLWKDLNSRNQNCALSFNINVFIVILVFLLLWAKFLHSMY
ncbi:hypothetical protein LSH36_762g00091 [Paralvinella palmiformis]|uniref:Hexosyltransferase n=1 Tax=Paralvinella palmiformis TaxID=53620 RepID=A0AAD9J0F6_9ANNE|nr:hypothetical protein LSH36_762g00091 [Paralvinella palmiformis]